MVGKVVDSINILGNKLGLKQVRISQGTPFEYLSLLAKAGGMAGCGLINNKIRFESHHKRAIIFQSSREPSSFFSICGFKNDPIAH